MQRWRGQNFGPQIKQKANNVHNRGTWIIVKKVDKKQRIKKKQIQLDWETNRYYENGA